VANAKGLCQFVKGDDCRVTAPSLKAADILLAEPGNFAELLLRQALFEPDPLNILGNHSAHIHAQNEK
jgi:hypothetical protein